MAARAAGGDVPGFDKLEARLSELTKRVASPRQVRVGFLESATGQDGEPIAVRAVVNNFGAPGVGIPPRPFFSNMIAEEGPKLPARMARVLAAADYDVDVALGRMGEGLKAALVKSITALDAPPLAPATIARKGFAKPLVDKGDMLNAVSSDLVGGSGAE